MLRPISRRTILLAIPPAILPAQVRRFTARARLVQIPVTVTDAKKRPIEDLTASDFLVLDDGLPQQFSLDTPYTETAPIAIVIAVQSSGISEAALAKIRRIGSMIQPLITGTRGSAAVVSFDEDIRWIQSWTRDPDEIANAFRQLRPREEKQACLLDAAYDAIRHLHRQQTARRILLMISESRDRSSDTNLGTVVLAAQAAQVTVYSATYSAFKTSLLTKSSRPAPLPETQPEATKPPKLPPRVERMPLPPPTEQQVDILAGIGELARLGKTKTTKALAAATGGATFSFTRQEALETAIEHLGAELHSQYVLSFTPESPEPGYHRLEVCITREGKYRVRARPGYWATSEP